MTRITSAPTDNDIVALPSALRMALSDAIGSVRQQLRRRGSTFAVVQPDAESRVGMRCELGGAER